MAISRAILDADPVVKSRLDTTASIEAIDEKRAIERAWEAVKQVIAKRDKYRCRLCGKACGYGNPIETRADAHHIIFASAGGTDDSWNLLHLCRGCHDLCHKVRRFWLSGNADDRDPAGKGCVKVERQVESGFEVVGFI
jgi:5-methylcytosine-specific restriction endonuclease McrA